ncbi:unnamed protein product [Brassica napus]|uniref:(rape) hypothetical protein n=1 Tax=Brassica napus TaxID=3708 RepID=A0A817AXR3_BRANA|nr:unnamed protein product [Brassica napus]
MTQRLSRSDKGKWVSNPNKQPRRPPILIPEPENNSLVEANKFTLIGRVTNPHIQKPRALPLEMLLDITLAAGGTKQVEIEYEKLEKHCFLCKSLSHEQDDCPQKRNVGNPNTEKKDINYSKTMESLDSYRRAKDDRKEERNRSSYQTRAMDSRPYYRSREDLYATPRGSRQRTPPRLYSIRDYYNKDASSALLVDRDRAIPPHYRRPREREVSRSLDSKREDPVRRPASQ